MTGRRAALGLLAVLSLVAAGCATPSAPPVGVVPAAETSRWAGRFAVTMTESGPAPGIDGREERASGRFLLEARNGSTQLELFSPFGQSLASATLDAGRARLLTSEGRLYEADSAEQLTEKVLGWRMPLADLPRWLRGRLDGATETEAGRPVAGQEHGWAVRLESWGTAGPGRLTLDWPAGAATDRRRVNLKLIVDDAS